jgi:hypothetical protein
MAKTGRPTKYKAEYCAQARKLCVKGFIDTEIAEFFDISEATLNNWKHAHPEFLESLKDGRVYSDDKVMNSLYNRALGFDYTETKTEDGDSGKKITVTTKKQVGDTTAQIFWLKNRQPKDWREKKEVEISLTDDFDSLLSDSADD